MKSLKKQAGLVPLVLLVFVGITSFVSGFVVTKVTNANGNQQQTQPVDSNNK